MVTIETIKASPKGGVMRVKETIYDKERQKEYKSLIRSADERAIRYEKPLPKYRGRIISKEKSQRVGRAVTGILGALMPSEALAGAVSYAKKGTKSGDGRGRPKGTFKARYVPGYGTVRVPTNVYRRMMSEAKAKRRLAEAQAQAKMQERFEAEQIATQQRAGYEQPDAFLEGPDMEHEAQIADIRQQQQYQQQAEQMRRQQAAQSRSGFATRTGAMFGKLGGGLWGPQSRQQQGQPGQQAEPYSARQVQGIIRPQLNQNQYNKSEPQVVVTSGKSIMFSKAPSILGQPNEFNRPRNAVLERGGVRRRNHL